MEEHIPLAPLTTFHIGGPARYFARVQDTTGLSAAFEFAKEKNIKVLIFGGGSNILVDDAGFDGLVIKIECKGIERKEDTLIVGAGESWDALVERSVHESLWGLENLSGIPGSVGGAVAGNIGAYGQALSQTLAWVELYDSNSGEVKKMTNTECLFGYRDSIFKKQLDSWVIVRAAFALTPTPQPDLSYKDLSQRFAGLSPTLEDIREAILTIRRAKFPDLEVEGTAGSFFKNPILPSVEAAALQAQYPQMPLFAMPETSGMKIPLAWLLDHVLTMRGARVGCARLFEQQPLVIAAENNCSAQNVRDLARTVKEKVKNNFQIDIEEEVRVL